ARAAAVGRIPPRRPGSGALRLARARRALAARRHDRGGHRGAGAGPRGRPGRGAPGGLWPALAVDGAGVRLGRGAGFYDRSLPLAAPTARLVAVVRDDELVDRLPAEPHEVRMTHALTPNGGLVALG